MTVAVSDTLLFRYSHHFVERLGYVLSISASAQWSERSAASIASSPESGRMRSESGSDQ